MSSYYLVSRLLPFGSSMIDSLRSIAGWASQKCRCRSNDIITSSVRKTLISIFWLIARCVIYLHVCTRINSHARIARSFALSSKMQVKNQGVSRHLDRSIVELRSSMMIMCSSIKRRWLLALNHERQLDAAVSRWYCTSRAVWRAWRSPDELDALHCARDDAHPSVYERHRQQSIALENCSRQHWLLLVSKTDVCSKEQTVQWRHSSVESLNEDDVL